MFHVAIVGDEESERVWIQECLSYLEGTERVCVTNFGFVSNALHNIATGLRDFLQSSGPIFIVRRQKPDPRGTRLLPNEK